MKHKSKRYKRCAGCNKKRRWKYTGAIDNRRWDWEEVDSVMLCYMCVNPDGDRKK